MIRGGGDGAEALDMATRQDAKPGWGDAASGDGGMPAPPGRS